MQPPFRFLWVRMHAGLVGLGAGTVSASVFLQLQAGLDLSTWLLVRITAHLPTTSPLQVPPSLSLPTLLP